MWSHETCAGSTLSTMTICLKYLGQGAYKTYLDDDSNKDTVELLYSTFALLWTWTVLSADVWLKLHADIGSHVTLRN